MLQFPLASEWSKTIIIQDIFYGVHGFMEITVNAHFNVA